MLEGSPLDEAVVENDRALEVLLCPQDEMRFKAWTELLAMGESVWLAREMAGCLKATPRIPFISATKRLCC
eukprot:42546-Pleurochrysis_carterae.AAC.2